MRRASGSDAGTARSPWEADTVSELSGIDLFTGMTAAELDRIWASGRVITPRDGARIFTQGDAADAVYAILSSEGHVRVGTTHQASKGLMVEIFQAGDIFGEVGVIDGSERTADAVAQGRIRLLRIGDSAFLAALAESPTLGVNLCRMLAKRLRRTFTLLEDATFESLEVRLARQVLYLAKREGQRTGNSVQLTGRFRQGDLADLLGATTRSIITILNAWRASGLVAYDPQKARLTICKEAELQRLLSDAVR
jgi:CRP/FNR family cyclic AMP-dependent transcriptional regulator